MYTAFCIRQNKQWFLIDNHLSSQTSQVVKDSSIVHLTHDKNSFVAKTFNNFKMT
jgi:hypothetical protein